MIYAELVQENWSTGTLYSAHRTSESSSVKDAARTNLYPLDGDEQRSNDWAYGVRLRGWRRGVGIKDMRKRKGWLYMPARYILQMAALDVPSVMRI